MLRLGILIPPAASGAGWLVLRNHGTRQAEIQLGCNRHTLQVLGSAQFTMNGELKLANLIPPVNLTTTLWTVTKAGS
jgi:hypothetical protein